MGGPRSLARCSKLRLKQNNVCSLSHRRLTGTIDDMPNRRVPVRKLKSPELSPFQFEPELVWMMRSVLDSAVDQIHAANPDACDKGENGGTNFAGSIQWNH